MCSDVDGCLGDPKSGDPATKCFADLDDCRRGLCDEFGTEHPACCAEPPATSWKFTWRAYAGSDTTYTNSCAGLLSRRTGMTSCSTRCTDKTNSGSPGQMECWGTTQRACPPAKSGTYYNTDKNPLPLPTSHGGRTCVPGSYSYYHLQGYSFLDGGATSGCFDDVCRTAKCPDGYWCPVDTTLGFEPVDQRIYHGSEGIRTKKPCDYKRCSLGEELVGCANDNAGSCKSACGQAAKCKGKNCYFSSPSGVFACRTLLTMVPTSNCSMCHSHVRQSHCLMCAACTACGLQFQPSLTKAATTAAVPAPNFCLQGATPCCQHPPCQLGQEHFLRCSPAKMLAGAKADVTRSTTTPDSIAATGARQTGGRKPPAASASCINAVRGSRHDSHAGAESAEIL